MRDDALPVRRLVGAGAAIALAVAVAIVAVLAMLAQRGVPPGGVEIDKPARVGANQPMLQAAPQPDLAAFRAEKDQALHGLGWVDRASGVAHVPIATAMALRAARAASAGAAP